MEAYLGTRYPYVARWKLTFWEWKLISPDGSLPRDKVTLCGAMEAYLLGLEAYLARWKLTSGQGNLMWRDGSLLSGEWKLISPDGSLPGAVIWRHGSQTACRDAMVFSMRIKCSSFAITGLMLAHPACGQAEAEDSEHNAAASAPTEGFVRPVLSLAVSPRVV